MTQRCGFVSILGAPNSGKSTLINALVGERIAIVSRKPQTTRRAIRGICQSGDSQLVFLDTPGLHRQHRGHLLNRAMNRAALATVAESDVILYTIDIKIGFQESDGTYLRELMKVKQPIILLTKIDALKKASVESQRQKTMKALREIDFDIDHGRVQMVSAKRPENVAQLKLFLEPLVPESPWLYPADQPTDQSTSDLAAEFIREQIFRQVGAEIPYNTAVRIDSFKLKQELVVISATILTSRATHKGMIIGRGGEKLRDIGTEARKGIEALLGKKVFLELQVDVHDQWLSDTQFIQELTGLVDPAD